MGSSQRQTKTKLRTLVTVFCLEVLRLASELIQRSVCYADAIVKPTECGKGKHPVGCVCHEKLVCNGKLAPYCLSARVHLICCVQIAVRYCLGVGVYLEEP